MRETTIDGQSALWLTMEADSQYDFMALFVSPPCGEEINAFFISAADSSEEQFMNFLDSISLTL